MTGEVSADKRVDLWLDHSNKLWRTVYATPLIAIGLFAGWYALILARHSEMAFMVLVLGILSMFIQFGIISRMAQYDAAFFTAIKGQLPEVAPPVLLLTGKQMAQSVPLLLIVMYLLLMVLTINAPESFLETSHV